MCSSTSISSPIEALTSAIDQLAAESPGEMNGVRLVEQVAELRGLANRLDAEFTRRVEIVHRRNDTAADGYLSTAAFLTHRLRMSRAEALQVVVTATQLPKLPGTEQAFAAGEISGRHAAVIAVGAEQLGAEIVARAEPILLDVARTTDPGRLRRVVAHLRYVVDPDGVDDDADAKHERRGLTVSPTLDGMVAVNGLLEPETGAALMAAVNSGPPPAAGDRRTAAQRRADRLGELLRLWAANEPSSAPGQSMQVTLTAGLDTLRGERGAAPGILDWFGPLDRSTTQLLACDCQVTGIVTDADGSPLDVGWRHRTATATQRKALAIRDRHCQAPGCDRPAQWCDSHHVVPWYHGGRTDLDNLVLLCRRHHRAVHRGVWRIEALGHGRFRFHLRDDYRRTDRRVGQGHPVGGGLAPPSGRQSSTPAPRSMTSSPRLP